MGFLEWYNHPLAVRLVFWIVAVIASSFYGWKCFDALEVKVNLKEKPWAWRFHQRWFNFFGSLVGWAALWLVFRKVCLYPSPIRWFDVALIAGAFVGVTGHLPFATAGLLNAIKDLALKALKFTADN
jgi:hypothetical protein